MENKAAKQDLMETKNKQLEPIKMQNKMILKNVAVTWNNTRMGII